MKSTGTNETPPAPNSPSRGAWTCWWADLRCRVDPVPPSTSRDQTVRARERQRPEGPGLLSLPRCLPQGAGSHLWGPISRHTSHPTWASQGSTGVWLRTACQGRRARPLHEEVTPPGLCPFGRQMGPTPGSHRRPLTRPCSRQRLQQNQPGVLKKPKFEYPQAGSAPTSPGYRGPRAGAPA